MPEPSEVDNQVSYEARVRGWLRALADGANFEFAYGAQGTRDRLKRGNVDVMVVGFGMDQEDWYPGKTDATVTDIGFRVIGEIRNYPTYAKTPIIIRTAFATGGGEVDKECQRLGINDFLTIPTMTSDLLDTIEKYLPK